MRVTTRVAIRVATRVYYIGPKTSKKAFGEGNIEEIQLHIWGLYHFSTTYG